MFINKENGWLSQNWVPVLKVDAQPGPEASGLLWNNEWAAKHQVEKTKMATAYEQKTKPPAAVQWSA